MRIAASAIKMTTCALAVASALAVGAAQAALVDLSNPSASSFDGDAPVLAANSALLAATSFVSYSVSNLTQFDWLFEANDYQPYDDFGFVNFGSGPITLASVSTVGDFGSSGWQTYVLGSSFTGTVTFGVNNVVDDVNDSTLRIRNATTAAVPEPATLALVGLALAGLGLGRRKSSA